jgi:aldehyde:ferredoxin oxidoreductase
MNLLRVNMTEGKISLEPFPQDRILGGRATIDYLLTRYGSPAAHPLSEENIFIVAPGILAGTSAPQSGRLSVGGKSPLTDGIKEANVGGTAAHKLGRLAIMGILVEGKAKEWQVLKINSQGASLEKAPGIVGLTNYSACERLRQKYGDKIGIIIIGPAGEMKLANSTVAVTDPEGRPSRHAARGGVGAIMGAKGLKAVVIDDEGGSLRKAVQEEAFREAAKKAAEAIQNFPLREGLHNMGTALFVNVDNGRGSFPTRNHREGSFEKAANIGPAKLVELVKARGGAMGHGCLPGCVVRCSPIFHDPSGKFLTAALEYETISMLGSNLGIDDLDAVARMDRKCDDLGLDTIEMGCTIGVLNDAGLFSFGDAAKAESLIDEIAKGTPLGRVLGSGVAVTARVFGIERVPAVKGQGIPAHAARSSKGWGVTYATSPQGADHTAGSVIEEPLSNKGQAERSRKAQIMTAALDATGLCLFTFLMPKLIFPMINALYGISWTVEDYLNMGKEMLRQERAFNLKAGIGPEADRLPDWMSKEPLPPTQAVFDVPEEDLQSVFHF